MSESTLNLIIGALLGIVGGLVTTPVNALILRGLKRDEQFLQHRLDMVAKKRELFLQHALEKEQNAKQSEIRELRTQILQLRNDFERLERRFR